MERYDLMGTPTASSEEAGVLRIASEVDEKNCGCKDAAITPSNLYSLLDCRKANTAYAAGVIVTCPYHKEFLLKCTTGGTTSASSLDTTAVTKGNVITDGGAKWTVIASQIIDLSISGKNITVTFIDGTQKTLTTQDTTGITTTGIMPNYSAGTSYTLGSAVSADGWVYVVQNNAVGRCDMLIRVNGYDVAYCFVDISYSQAGALIPVSKGDVVTEHSSYSNFNGTFYPCKG